MILRRIKDEKEKELQRLREMQEKANDRQVRQDLFNFNYLQNLKVNFGVKLNIFLTG